MWKRITLVMPLASLLSAQDIDVRELMKRINAAVGRVDTMSLTATIEFPDSASPANTMQVFTRRDRRRQAPYAGDIRLNSKDGSIVAFVARDRVLVINKDRKHVTAAEQGTPLHVLFHDLWFDSWIQFIHPSTFADEIKATRLMHRGYESVSGQRCHRVHVKYKDGSESSWWFGTEDLLPRRVVRLGKQRRRTTFANPRPNVEFGDQVFSRRFPRSFAQSRIPGPSSLNTAAELLSLADTKAEQLPRAVGKVPAAKLVMVDEWLAIVEKWFRTQVMAAAKDNADWRKRAARIGLNKGVPPHITQQVMDNAPGSTQANYYLFVTELRVLIGNILRERQAFRGTPILRMTAQARNAALQMLEMARTTDPVFFKVMKRELEKIYPELRAGVEKTFRNAARLATAAKSKK